MEKMETDVLVVGAGPTGLILSNLLSTHGISCVLVEKNPSTGTEPRAVSIDDESLRTLQAIGIIEYFLPLISQNYGSYYLSPAGKPFAIIEPTDKRYGFFKRNGFDQPELEEVLLKKLQKSPNVKIFFDSQFEHLKEEKQCVTSIISISNKPIKVKSKYVVGCDGGTSNIRKILGIKLKGLSFNERWLIVDLYDTTNKFRHTQVHCDSKRPCITLPGPNGIRRYEFKLKESECQDYVSKENFVRNLFNERGWENNSKIRRTCVYTFNALVAESWNHNNIFLAGDSAHLTPPFAGQGMNSGVRDAHNLSWKLAYAMKYKNKNILNTYELERKAHIWQMIKMSIFMGKILAPKNIFVAFFTRFLFMLFSVYGPIRKYFSQMRFKPEPYFKKGLLWYTSNKKYNRMVGRLFPQPLVEDSKGNQFLLDELCNNKCVVIVFSKMPEKQINDDLIKEFLNKDISIIGVTPEWINPSLANFNIVRDVSNLLLRKSFESYLDKAFFVRPDRYVAAISSINSIGSLSRIADEIQNKA